MVQGDDEEWPQEQIHIDQKEYHHVRFGFPLNSFVYLFISLLVVLLVLFILGSEYLVIYFPRGLTDYYYVHRTNHTTFLRGLESPTTFSMWEQRNE